MMTKRIASTPEYSRMLSRLGMPAVRLQMQSKYGELNSLLEAETRKPNCPKWYKKCYTEFRKVETEEDAAVRRAESILDFRTNKEEDATLTQEDFESAKEMLEEAESEVNQSTMTLQFKAGVSVMRSAYERKRAKYRPE